MRTRVRESKSHRSTSGILSRSFPRPDDESAAEPPSPRTTRELRPRTDEFPAPRRSVRETDSRKAGAMRKLIYGMNLTLDGYIAAPGDDIGWSVPS
ncbi:hypothetical protein ACWGBX_35510, partial [Streptomyces sp. NPDC055037]